MTVSTSLPVSYAINPTIEKMTKPAKILVTLFRMAMINASLEHEQNTSG